MELVKAVLALEDGRYFQGHSFTGRGEAWGEIVFNTSMTGYQEVLTDPSYAGQIVTMTYPHVGNYGVNDQDVESERVRVEGFILREYHPMPSNWRSQRTLADYLASAGVLGLTGLDTRALTRHIRERGAMMGYMSTEDLNPESLAEKARSVPKLDGRDLVKDVACPQPYVWEPDPEGGRPECRPGSHRGLGRDQGRLQGRGHGLWDKIQYLEKPDQIRGQGSGPAGRDSAGRDPGIRTGRHLPVQRPRGSGRGRPTPMKTSGRSWAKNRIFGICLGHQLMGLALKGTDLQTEVRSPGGQPAGQGPDHGPDRDHQPEPRLFRGHRQPLRPERQTDPRQPQ